MPQVIDDPEVVASYTTDWTGRFAGRSTAVVRPGSTEEVAGVVATCRELGVTLVPQGGNTGLVGGGVPLHDEVVLSLQRLQILEPVGRPGRPGHRRRRGAPSPRCNGPPPMPGWAYGVDLGGSGLGDGGRERSATNAGGTHLSALRRHPGQQVLGVEAVLGTGVGHRPPRRAG